MDNCGVILAIIIILAFLFFLWSVFQLDGDSGVYYYDSCGNPINPTQASPEITIVETIRAPEVSNVIKACLAKFAQAEHELDSLCRSYIIEHRCSCQDADNTYERIQALCRKLGDCLALLYGQEVGDRYAELRKSCYNELKKCVTNSEKTVRWIYYETKIAELLASNNSCLSKKLLEEVRKDHCNLTLKMIETHNNGNNLEAMILYDSIKEKTDIYVENVVSATLRCKV